MKEKEEVVSKVALLEVELDKKEAEVESSIEQRASEVESLKKELEMCRGFEEQVNGFNFQMSEDDTLASVLKSQHDERGSRIQELESLHTNEIKRVNEEIMEQRQEKEDLFRRFHL